MGPDTPPHQQDEHYRPPALAGVTLIALLGFAVFFLNFLVAPLAILTMFFVGFSASDRSKGNESTALLADEADIRRHVIQRVEEEPPVRAPSLSRAGA